MAAAFSLLAMPPSPGRIPFLGGDVLVAALMGRPLERGVDVMRPIKRLLDVLFADGRGVPTARTLDERLQVGAPGFVERNRWLLAHGFIIPARTTFHGCSHRSSSTRSAPSSTCRLEISQR